MFLGRLEMLTILVLFVPSFEELILLRDLINLITVSSSVVEKFYRIHSVKNYQILCDR